MCRREQQRSGGESWTQLCRAQTISRIVECLWGRLNVQWLRDRSLSYVDPRRATHERVYEQAIEGHLFGGEMETAGWDVLLKKNENFKISAKDIDFFVVSHHGHLSGFPEALYAAMGKKAILNIVSIHHNDEHIMRAIRRKLMPQGLMAVSRFRSRDLAADDTQPGVAVPNEPAVTAPAENGR